MIVLQRLVLVHSYFFHDAMSTYSTGIPSYNEYNYDLLTMIFPFSNRPSAHPKTKNISSTINSVGRLLLSASATKNRLYTSRDTLRSLFKIPASRTKISDHIPLRLALGRLSPVFSPKRELCWCVCPRNCTVRSQAEQGYDIVLNKHEPEENGIEKPLE